MKISPFKLERYFANCNSAPSAFLASLALLQKEKIVKRNLDVVRHNVDLLNDFFAKYQHIFSWWLPKAGSITFPSLKIDQDVESFCHDLVEKAGVLLLPCTYFDFGDKNFRVGFGRKNMPDALERLEAYVREKF